VRLSPDEAWELVESSHTGILTTLRRDRVPVALPVWFVVLDRRVVMRTPAPSKKVSRLRRDPTASFLVEAGERWAELRAVHLTGRVELLDDEGELAAAVQRAWDEKYGAFTTARQEMPDATRQVYAVPYVLLRLDPDERILSWDNARLGLDR